MKPPRFYTPQALISHTVITLEPRVAHHMTTVLRMRTGQSLVLFNGDGGEYTASLERIEKRQVWVAVGEQHSVECGPAIAVTLGVCLVKPDPMDWLVQKATELGVQTIAPLLSEFTDYRLPAARMTKKVQHWQQITIGACQQCGRTHLPQINSPQALSPWLRAVSAQRKIVLHPDRHGHTHPKPWAQHLVSSHSTHQSVALLVGPEGGLSQQEVKLAIAADFVPVNLGSRLLRTETAALVAMGLLQYG